MPSAPVVAGGLVFTGDRRGVVRAIDLRGNVKWKTYTGGAVYFPPAVAQGRVYAGSADGWVYAFEAATGRRLWRFRVGPAERFIPVYGSLSSTWPVAGGIVVHDGVVYAAAGIAHYDGTHVVALDAITGKPRWYNNTSGVLSEKVESGISLQGNLCVAGDELQFSGGGIYDVARYDLRTGACRNVPHEGVNSRFQTAFYAYYPDYGQYVSLHHALPDGSTLDYDASYEGSGHSSLALRAPAPPGAEKSDAQAARRRGAGRKAVWEVSGRRFNSLIVAPGAVLAAGQRGDPAAPVSFLAAIDIASGKEIWYEELPAPPVKGGAAIDRDGRIVVSLASGQILCFAGAE
jgi:outer membrane protein assembly factor BamB